MSTEPITWFSVSAPGSAALRCAACHKDIDLGFPSLDHHSSWCPACGVECVFLTCRDILVQLVLTDAPQELTRIIRWTQENLDEPEMIAVLVSLTQVAEAVRAGSELVQRE